MNTHDPRTPSRHDHHPLGSDRFLIASVGATPGASALFVGERRVRVRAARRSLRTVLARRVHDLRHSSSMFADSNATDYNDFMGRRRRTSASESYSRN